MIPIAKPYLDDTEYSAVAETMATGWISQGPRVAEFETAMADYVGTAYGRAVNSGTSAILLALLACGVRPGDEVIVPAFTCVATLNPIELIGARPILVDIGLDDFGLDASRLTDAITHKTRAVIIVHLFGLPARVIQVRAALSGYKTIKLIEDAALGLGGRLDGVCVGSFGDAACLSFHPRKIVTTGEGGMVLTNSKEVANTVARLRNYGASVSALQRHSQQIFELPCYHEAGLNCKLTDIQASIGIQQLRKLDAMIQRRRGIARIYDEAFAGVNWLRPPIVPPNDLHAYQSYTLLLDTSRIDDPGALQSLQRRLFLHLAGRGIASVQGVQAMATVDYYRHKYRWKPEDCPNALIADNGTVCLPIYPSLTNDEQCRVIEAVRDFCP
jgi:dTDP-4-amino-4,6-dideoxygalactose transaminase